MKTALFFLSILLPVCCFPQSPCETSSPIPFEDHGKWGYITSNGIAIPPHFDYAGPFTGDGAMACVANQCGWLGRTGSFVTQTWNRQSFPSVDVFSEGLGVVVRNGRWGYVDRERNVVIPLRFDYAGQFDHGMARVVLKDKAFFIDKTGTRVTPEFDGAFDFREDLAAVEVGKNIGYIRRDGSFALPPIHQSASGIDFSEGLAAVRIHGIVGFMDSTGGVVIKPAYDDVFAFSDGLAPVELGEKWGYIDRSGNVTIPATYDAAMPFCAGLAAVEKFQKIGKTTDGCLAELYRGKHGLIDHAGNYVWRESEEQTWRSSICH